MHQPKSYRAQALRLTSLQTRSATMTWGGLVPLRRRRIIAQFSVVKIDQTSSTSLYCPRKSLMCLALVSIATWHSSIMMRSCLSRWGWISQYQRLLIRRTHLPSENSILQVETRWRSLTQKRVMTTNAWANEATKLKQNFVGKNEAYTGNVFFTKPLKMRARTLFHKLLLSFWKP